MSVGLAGGGGALGAIHKLRTRTPSAAELPKQVRLIEPNLSTAWLAETQRRRTLILAVLTVAITALFTLLVAWFHVLSAIVLLTWIVCAAIAWRPLVGLCVAFFLTQVFEAGGADQIMLPGFYLNGSLGSTVGLSGAIASPIELLLILIFAVWLAQGMVRRKFHYRSGSLGRPMALFLGALILGLARGISSGGNFNIALWESRFLFYMVICYVVAANTVRTKRHLHILISLFMIANLLFAAEGMYRRLALIDTNKLGVIAEFAYSHEDVVFLGSALLLVLAQWAYGAPAWQKLIGLLLLAPTTGFTLLATERRAGYIALMIGFVAFALIFMRTSRKTFWFFVIPVLIGTAIYLPIFWNNTTMVGQPARAVRSLSSPDPRDAGSNMYRDLELVNVRATIHSSPILGVGFGQQFFFVVPLPDLSWWPFWHYEPHHNILWLWLKMGAVGFIIFFTLMGTGLARSAYLVRTLVQPERRVFAMLTLSAIVTTLVFCYVDLGLVSGRVTIFLGTALGTLSILEHITD
jgi:hypothetical protein